MYKCAIRQSEIGYAKSVSILQKYEIKTVKTTIRKIGESFYAICAWELNSMHAHCSNAALDVTGMCHFENCISNDLVKKYIFFKFYLKKIVIMNMSK